MNRKAMKEFSNSGKFLVSFLIFTIISMSINKEFTFYMLLLIFFGQLIINSDVLQNMFKLGGLENENSE